MSFAGTDLSESRMCWNDFVGCDFSGADLSGCDMRASKFEQCRFAGASLRGADLRRSSFEGCEFSTADLTGTIAEDSDAIGWLTDRAGGRAWANEGPSRRAGGRRPTSRSGAAGIGLPGRDVTAVAAPLSCGVRRGR